MTSISHFLEIQISIEMFTWHAKLKVLSVSTILNRNISESIASEMYFSFVLYCHLLVKFVHICPKIIWKQYIQLEIVRIFVCADRQLTLIITRYIECKIPSFRSLKIGLYFYQAPHNENNNRLSPPHPRKVC